MDRWEVKRGQLKIIKIEFGRHIGKKSDQERLTEGCYMLVKGVIWKNWSYACLSLIYSVFHSLHTFYIHFGSTL